MKESTSISIIESEIISQLPVVTAQIFDEFPHLLQHRRHLSTRIPGPDTEVDAIIGVKDKPKLMLKDDNTSEINAGCPRNPCVMKNIDDSVKLVIQVQPTIFGDIVEGGINNAIEEFLPAGKKQGRGVDIINEYKNHEKETNDDNTFESILAVRDVPLDILLNKVFETEISEKDIKDKSQLQQKALERFNQTHVLIPQDDGNFRFKINI